MNEREDIIFFGAGRVTPTSVRLWLRAPSGTAAEVVLDASGDGSSFRLPERREETDHTQSFCWPDDVDAADSLRPDTRYEARLLDRDGAVLARCSFRTLPEDGEVRYVFASCHEPFGEDWSFDEESIKALEAFADKLQSLDPHLVFLIGDQVYVDAPPSTSLFRRGFDALSLPAQDLRRLLHGRYRAFWDVPGWREILSECACVPILDDHDIVDNYGASPIHLSDEWSDYRAGAFAAYRDYQGARVSSSFEKAGPFAFGVSAQSCAVFVTDCRSQRLLDEAHPVLGAQQKRDLGEFLETNAGANAIVVVCTVPLFHVPNVVAKLAEDLIPGADDVSDRWDAPQFRADRDWLLRTLRDHQARHPDQHLILVGGDIHVGTLQEGSWCNGSGSFTHLITSAISHRPGEHFRHLSALGTTRLEEVVAADDERLLDITFLGPEQMKCARPYTGLNMGFLTVGPDRAPKIELLGFDGERVSTVITNRPD